jgi:hypothetical protein
VGAVVGATPPNRIAGVHDRTIGMSGRREFVSAMAERCRLAGRIANSSLAQRCNFIIDQSPGLFLRSV